MWVTKLLISPVKKRIFCPETTKFGPNLAFLTIAGSRCPVDGLAGGCGARAVSRKTPIYFILSTEVDERQTPELLSINFDHYLLFLLLLEALSLFIQ